MRLLPSLKFRLGRFGKGWRNETKTRLSVPPLADRRALTADGARDLCDQGGDCTLSEVACLASPVGAGDGDIINDPTALTIEKEDMPVRSEQILYFDAAEKVMTIIGRRILAEVFTHSKFIEKVHRNWEDDDPRRGNDVYVIRDDATVTFFEYAYAIKGVKITANYATTVKIDEAVNDMTEMIDRNISASLSKDSKIEDCTYYSRPFPDPTLEMEQFGLYGKFKTIKDRDLGISILFSWDSNSFSPTIGLRFLGGAKTPTPPVTSSH
jgi:hypothetical protein